MWNSSRSEATSDERSGGSGGRCSGVSSMSEYIWAVLVLLVGWALIALGVFASEGGSVAVVLAGVLISMVSLLLLMRPRS
jgi:hypothetical protein